MEQSSLLKNLQYQYQKSNTYSPVYVNGAIGGITSKGDIVINFFIEYPPTPDSQVFEIKNGNVGNEMLEKRLPRTIQEDGPVISRQILTGVMLNYAEAKGLHEWLGMQLKIIEESIKR